MAAQESIRHLLAHVPHIAVATVGAMGEPHNTPVRGVFNNVMHVFWASSPQAEHSQNIARDGSAYIVLFDSERGGAGLYMAGKAQALEEGESLEYAYGLLKRVRARDMDSIDRFRGNGPQRIYRFIPENMWMHHAVKDDDGYFITDERVPITLADIEP